MADERFLDVLLRRVCERYMFLVSVLALLVLTFFLMLVSLFVVEPGTATFVVVVLNLIGTVLFGALFGVLVLACRAREENRSWR